MAIKQYGWDAFESVILETIETDDKNFINEREKFFIKEKDSFKNGYNMTEGGDGIVMIGEKNPFYGKKYTDEEKKKISEATKKAMQDPEIRKRISETKRGEKNYNFNKHLSEETRKRISTGLKGKFPCKKVYKYNNDGILLEEFNSLYEIQEKYGYNDSHISRCCKGKAKTAYGFIWRFEKI